jgi:hypothetical protein
MKSNFITWLGFKSVTLKPDGKTLEYEEIILRLHGWKLHDHVGFKLSKKLHVHATKIKN